MILPSLKLTRRHILLVAMIGVLVQGIAAASASAELVTFEGKLGSKEWTCSKCYVQKNENGIFVEHEGPGGICVGPVQYSNGKFIFPYGWECSTGHDRSWEFPNIEASEGIDNPSAYSYRYNGWAT